MAKNSEQDAAEAAAAEAAVAAAAEAAAAEAAAAEAAAAAAAEAAAAEAAAAVAPPSAGTLAVKLTSFYGDNAPGDIVNVDPDEARRIVTVGGGVPAPDEDAAE